MNVAKKKVVSPCKVKSWTRSGNEVMVQAYCKIELRQDGEKQELSISGVVGPMPNGYCKGSCGQCVDEIRAGEPFGSWTPEMLEKFCTIWDNWHLNGMRPYCQHQKELGWDKIASKKAKIYHYTKKREIRENAEKRLLDGETVSLDNDEMFIGNLETSLDTWEQTDSEFYMPKKPLFAGDKGFEEEKLLGWLRPEEHPDGILCKPCPVCGYKYGTAWKTEPLPQEVIDWLFALPAVEGQQPAWV